MSLWDEISRGAYGSVSVFGLAKNAGKTVVLNHLASRATEEGVLLGLTSIGRDGETWDVITHRLKPAVHAIKGTFLATAEQCLEAGTAKVEIIERTGIRTPLGEVVLARVRKPGEVELAGPGRIGQLRAVVGLLKEHGSEFVLVDGAIDRQAPASPRVTQGCVMATGAILDEVMEEVVQKTVLRVRQLTLPVASGDYREKFKHGSIVLLEGGRDREIPGTTVLKGRSRIRETLHNDDTTLLVGGALTDPLLRELVHKRVRVVVRDATHVFVEGTLMSRFLDSGGLLEAAVPVRLAAVSVNPFSPEGWSFDPQELYEAVKTALPEIPVFDVMLEKKKGANRLLK
jgi:hypothetical protein